MIPLLAEPSGDDTIALAAVNLDTEPRHLVVNLESPLKTVVRRISLNLQPGQIWRDHCGLALGPDKRIIVRSSVGHLLRRWAGSINGTYYGYPENRKNLRFHYHPVPPDEVARILKYEY
jgi:hypothetical protein